MENNFKLSAKSLGERLKKIRTDQGMSRDQLAELFKISRATIQNYENGERSPNAEYLANYYKFFGINLHWLITGNGAATFQSFLLDGNAISSPREEMILHLTRQLNPQALNHLIDFLLNIQGIKTN
ncbi:MULTISPECIES: helix-turn-helix domain-containing protein [Neisseria]|uniref:helix-turn-helix domain-containing protein n=2 Tax=Neisseria lactamica TaxID=486 RepID=UPI000E57E508|nr:helix-turn-helix transcriptional regulator [Neisseria lactamica]